MVRIMADEIILYDYEISNDCCNEDSFGEVCLKCGQCGRKFVNGMLQKDGADNTEYIDRLVLKNDGHLCWYDGKGNTFYEVDHAPIVDAVEVVRCKDCRFKTLTEDGEYDPEDIVCEMHMSDGFKANDYCSYGKRMIEGNE